MKIGKHLLLSLVLLASAIAAQENIPELYIQYRHTIGAGIPLVLVHGDGSELRQSGLCRWDNLLNWANTSTAFAPFDIYMFKHDTTQPIGFNGTTGNAAELAAALQKYLPGQKVLFLAHSRGGLVCRGYMNYNNQGDNVIGLITLSTPHHGSPLAVPDWVGYRFGATRTPRFVFNKLCNDKQGARFCTRSVGDLNLAWDNSDKAIVNFVPMDYKVSICNDLLQLTVDDANDVSTGIGDNTRFLTDEMKRDYGTLGELNRKEKYESKILAIGAYTENVSGLASNGVFDDSVISDLTDAMFSDLDDNEHRLLWYGVDCLATMQNINPNRHGNYYANDGLVPLQSSLFLKLDDETEFARLNGDNVELIQSAIAPRQRVKSISIKGDHLSLVDSQVPEYWAFLAKQIYETAGLPAPIFRNPAPVARNDGDGSAPPPTPQPGTVKELKRETKFAGKAIKNFNGTFAGKNGQAWAEAILACTHPTGNTAKLVLASAGPNGNQVSGNVTISWKGGLTGNDYMTTVTWTFDDSQHISTTVTSDNAVVGVDDTHKARLDEMFKRLYPSMKK